MITVCRSERPVSRNKHTITQSQRHLRDLMVIKECLRQGFHPTDFGAAIIGNGAGRAAYKVGSFVIKQADQYAAPRRKAKQEYKKLKKVTGVSVRIAPTIKVKKHGVTWDIQRMYRRIPKHLRKRFNNRSPLTQYDEDTVFVDIHAGNFGYDHRGRLVAFDW
jgi:hypothetical protein